MSTNESPGHQADRVFYSALGANQVIDGLLLHDPPHPELTDEVRDLLKAERAAYISGLQ